MVGIQLLGLLLSLVLNTSFSDCVDTNTADQNPDELFYCSILSVLQKFSNQWDYNNTEVQQVLSYAKLFQYNCSLDVQISNQSVVEEIAKLKEKLSWLEDKMTHYLDSTNGNVTVSGPKGDCSCPPGPPGEKGDMGFHGRPGLDGRDGLPGIPGPQGLPGFDGLPGPRGESGEPGICDCERTLGPKPRGSPGYPGFPGIPGLPGEKGKPGLTGLPGHQGVPGLRGLPGISGHKGEMGFPGFPGQKGDIGDRGFTGQKGDIGDRGFTGPKGEAGFPGQKGATGEKGDSGKCDCI